MLNIMPTPNSDNKTEGAQTPSPSFASKIAAISGLAGSETFVQQMNDLSTNPAAQNTEGQNNNAAPAATDQNAQTQSSDNTGITNPEGAAAADSTKVPATPEPKDDGVVTPLGTLKPKGAKPAGTDLPKFETFEKDALPHINKTFGVQLKSLDDLPSFLEGSVAKWRADASKLTEVEKRANGYQRIFENLEPDLFEAVQTYYAKGDWRAKIKTAASSIDFAKPVEQHNTKDLVNQYYPGKFTDEDFANDAKKAEIEIALEGAKRLYTTEKTVKDGKRAAALNDAKTKVERVNTSIEGSVSTLKQSFPDLPQDHEVQIRGLMEGGTDGILSLFVEQDGTFKQGAAEMLVMAIHGKETINSFMDYSAKRAETKTAEDILLRTPAEIKTGNKNNANDNEVSPNVAKRLNALKGLTNEFTF